MTLFDIALAWPERTSMTHYHIRWADSKIDWQAFQTMDGIAATRIIRQDMPETEVIVISQNDPKVAARQARDVNARGYLSNC